MKRQRVVALALALACAAGCGRRNADAGLYDRGLELMTRGRYVEARHVFELLVERDAPGEERDAAELKVARILHLYEAKPADALAHYDALAERGGAHAFEANKAIAEIYRYHYRDLEGALRVYQEMIDRFEGRANVEPCYLAIAEIEEARGHYVEARAAYTRFLERFPDSPRAAGVAYQRAYTYSVEGKPQRALEMLKEFDTPGIDAAVRADAEFARAEALMELDRERDALPIYQALRDTYPNRRIVETRIAKIQDRERQRLAAITRERTRGR